MSRSKWTFPDNEELLREAVSQATSIAGVCRNLGLAPRGGNLKTIKHHIARLDLDVSHHLGQGWRKEQYLAPDKVKGTYAIRSRLLRERGHRCERCNLSEWMGEPIPIEMDHINGDNTDHREENLRLLCSNCHALTPTFRNKRGWKKKSSWKAGVRTNNICSCGKEIGSRANQCKSCVSASQDTKIDWPSVEEVVEQVRLTNFSQAGKILGVSDNAIRKFLKKNGIDPKSLT